MRPLKTWRRVALPLSGDEPVTVTVLYILQNPKFNMFTNVGLISCNFSSPSLVLRNSKLGIAEQIQYCKSERLRIPKFSISPNTNQDSKIAPRKMGLLEKRQSVSGSQSTEDTVGERGSSLESDRDGGGGGGDGGQGRDWTTSILLFSLWVVLMFYVFNIAPNQTPSMDMYFLKKLLNLKADDGFKMNEVLVSLWYMMGLWPLVYSMLLIPSGRSSRSSVPVWPFLVLSFFGGAYALLPYFVLWKPPPPPVQEAELQRWPLNSLESKFTAGIIFGAGVGILGYAGLAGGDVWKEFYQYFRGSRFIHAMTIDFLLLSSFAPFWVYNDMTARKWFEKGSSWVLPLLLIPFVGPALYLILRPSLTPPASQP